MATNRLSGRPTLQTTANIEPEAKPRRFARLKLRSALGLGVIMLAVIIIAFASGRLRTSHNQVAEAAQPSGDSLSPRAYQFTGQGNIQGGSGAAWVIGGVPIQVSDQTQIQSDIHPGDSVSVLGHLTKDGTWLAERITPIAEDDSYFSFAGPLESRIQTAWRVAGITLAVNDQTHLGASIQVNELVLATFVVQPDGTWLARNIEALSAVATPTPTPLPASTNPPVIQKTAAPKNPPNPAKPPNQSDQVTICHKPGGKKGGHTMVVEGSGLGGHLGHGDSLGPCSGPGKAKRHRGGH
jgi:hypothetical protein